MEIIDLQKKNCYSEVDVKESELSQIIFQNWAVFFPDIE